MTGTKYYCIIIFDGESKMSNERNEVILSEEVLDKVKNRQKKSQTNLTDS